METHERKETLLKEFSPMLEKTDMIGKIAIVIFALLVLGGIYAVYLQFTQGQVITGMRDNVVWGFYGVNFLYLLGISYAAAFTSAVLHFLKTTWKNSIIRIIEVVTVLSLMIGPLFIFLCIGRLDRLHYLFMYPRIQSPITWDVVAITTDLVVCIVYLYMTFIPDFAILRDHKELNLPQWRKNLYRWLALGYHNTPTQKARLFKATRSMSAMIIMMAIAVYTILAWIFSLTLQPGWNSTIFAPYFMVTGIYAGFAVILLAMYIVRRRYKLQEYIKRRHFTIGGFVMMIVALLYGYFTFSEYFSKWYSNKEQDVYLLNALFDRYFWYFIFANYVTVFLPVIVLLFRKLRTINLITFTAVVAIVGIWINRYLIVVPTLENPFIPIQDTMTRIEYIYYSPTWIEWLLIAAGIGAFCLLFTIIAKFVPIIPIHELLDEPINKSKLKSLEDSGNGYKVGEYFRTQRL
jgi:Ni/Fe-hydrogenase subunit HybB-like protein